VRVGVIVAVGDKVSVGDDRVTVGGVSVKSVAGRLGVHAPRIKVRKRSRWMNLFIWLKSIVDPCCSKIKRAG